MRIGRRYLWGAAGLVSLLAVAACTPPEDPLSEFAPESSVPPELAPVTREAPVPTTPTVSELEAFYQSVEQSFLDRGLLRTEKAPVDTPYGARQLVDNFVRIALFGEYTETGSTLVARQSASKLHRWDDPVRLKIVFGDSVPEAKRARDRNAIRSYAAQLSRASGHPVSLVSTGGNFTVFIVNEAERQALGPDLQVALPRISPAVTDAILTLPRNQYCLAVAEAPENDGIYRRAIAVIRAEHPDLFRLSCIHEEIAQGMGLTNDSPSARPSIFNDDEEFALLTEHDERLLQILYDPRLAPGMTEGEARPIVQDLAESLINPSPGQALN